MARQKPSTLPHRLTAAGQTETLAELDRIDDAVHQATGLYRELDQMPHPVLSPCWTNTVSALFSATRELHDIYVAAMRQSRRDNHIRRSTRDAADAVIAIAHQLTHAARPYG